MTIWIYRGLAVIGACTVMFWLEYVRWSIVDGIKSKRAAQKRRDELNDHAKNS